MLLGEDHRAVQDAVRAYVQDRIAPQAAAWDKSHHFPKDELRGLAELGCYGVAVPTEWGGAGLDYLANRRFIPIPVLAHSPNEALQVDIVAGLEVAQFQLGLGHQVQQASVHVRIERKGAGL